MDDGSSGKGKRTLLNRRDEIVAACELLYRNRSFKEISIKDISAAITFTRTSIYNYFKTKEEIFLALLTREYWQWVEQIAIIGTRGRLDVAEFARELAASFEERGLMLKLLSINLYDMESNSRLDHLVDFKLSYSAALKAVDACLSTNFPSMTDHDRQEFIYAFFPFIFGIYPYTTISEKQLAAMSAAKVDFVLMTTRKLVESFVKRLLQKHV